jgi:hypothetical protein
MSLSDAQFLAWLKSGSRRGAVLVEAVASVGGVETTHYLSNTGYTTSAADTPASTGYTDGKIVGGAKIIERLSLDGTGAGMSFGDIEIDNEQGDLDPWLGSTYIWANRSVKMYVGDVTWPRADFRLVFDGVAADLASRNRNVLNLVMREKLQRLNTAVTETKLGGSSANADRLLPIVLGEVHNLEPLLADKATLKYQVHDGAMEDVIEVRDNGVVVSATETLASGYFSLSASPAGVVTCSAQGAKLSGTYVNTVAKLVELLATTYGADPFTGSDLDTANLSAFNTANPQPVGRPLTERENVLAVCQELAASVGAQVITTAAGLLQLVKIDLAGTSPTAVGAAQMDEKSLRIVSRLPVQAAVKLGYCRNWTVQKNLQTGIPPEHADLYGQEWLTSTASDSTVATDYKLMQEPVQQVDTLLLVKTDADTEAARRLALWKTPRRVFGYVGGAELMLETLGGYQTITHNRFNLSGGVDGQIVAIERDWLNASVAFEVLT